MDWLDRGEFGKMYHMSKVLDWIDRGGDVNVTSFSKQGLTLLMMACIEDHGQLCGELIKRNADVNMKANGKTALMHSAVHGTPDCTRHLLSRKDIDVHIRSDVDDSDFTSMDGMTALEMIEEEITREGMKPRNKAVLDMLRERVHGTVAPQVSVKALLPSPPSPPPHSPSDGSWVDSRPITWEPRKPGRSA